MPRYDAGASGSLVGEYDGSGSLIQETVWLGDIPVATLRPNGSSVAIYYVVTDQIDAPLEVVRPSDNTVIWTWFSGPFGSDATNTNPQGAGAFTYDLRFPGQIAGVWGSTFQNDFRDFDPATGRYVESDPIGLRGASFSTYAYVNGNPLSYVDPLGLAPPLPPGVLPHRQMFRADLGVGHPILRTRGVGYLWARNSREEAGPCAHTQRRVDLPLPFSPTRKVTAG